MNITERQLEAARALLPDADVTAQGRHIGFRVGADFYITDCHEDTAIFCDLLKRACESKQLHFDVANDPWVPKKKRVRVIIVKGGPEYEDEMEEFCAYATTELDAWLEAVAELMERAYGGIPVVIDEKVPPDEVHFVTDKVRAVIKIEQEPTNDN